MQYQLESLLYENLLFRSKVSEIEQYFSVDLHQSE